MERGPGAPIVTVGRAQQAVKPGSVIADKYRVEKELGRGGFGIVVRARHLAIDQLVAIKVLTVGEGGAEEWKEDAARFKREAQATAALKSEHVVRILDVDFLEGGSGAPGSPYMVMEYLEGETLHHTIHTRGPLPVEEAVDHAVQVLAALAEAHAAGIVHRDLKPANVFVTKGAGGTPVAKVLDFGVSKIAAQSGIGTISTASHAITKTGAVIGTVAYMAPEQMVDAKRVDARADLWSLGILLYELLTQKTPFGPANSPTIVTQMLTRPPTLLSVERPGIPPKLEAIVMRCLEKLPEKRPSSAASLGAQLAPFASMRARAALESLRRAAKPTGAAAPVEKGAPRIVPGKERGSDRGAQRFRRLTLFVAIAGAIATVLLLGMAAGIVLGTPRIGRTKKVRAAPSASASASVDGAAPAPSSDIPRTRGE